MKNNCVIYPRFSSYGQNEQSIESQIRTCKEFAESKGLNVINIYPEKARSGTNDNRPAFQKMIKDAASGTFQYIIVYMMDRFARNRRDSIMYKEMLKKNYGIKVLSALEPITDDEGGEFYEMFLEWNAEKYSKRLSKRVRDGLETNVANGIYCGGVLVYGYKIEIEPTNSTSKRYKKRVYINHDEAKIVQFIFEQYDKGFTKKEIAKQLNARGERFRGKNFTSKSFDRLLTNEKYTGEFLFGGRQCLNTYPPIIEKALFQRVQQRLTKNKYVAGGMASAKIPYLLTGKLYCGHCGTAMVSDNGTGKLGKKYFYYACKKKRKADCNKHRENKDELELYVTSCVLDFLQDKNNVEIIIADVLNYYNKRTEQNNLKSITTKIANINKEIEKLTDAFVNATSTLLQNSINKKMNEYEILLNDLYAQQAQLELEIGNKISKQDIESFIELLLKGDVLDKDFQKKIIDNLVKQVYVSDDNTIVYFNIRGSTTLETEKIDFEQTKQTKNTLLGVRTQSLLLRQFLFTTNSYSNYILIVYSVPG